MKQLFHDLERLIVVEEQIPALQQECNNLKDAVNEAASNVVITKWEVNALENPGFFTRLMGRLEEKKQKAWTAYRSAVAEKENADRAYQEKTDQLTALQNELSQLLPARERYSLEKESLRAIDPEEFGRMEMHWAAIEGVSSAWKILSYLQEAQKWMRVDAVRTRVSGDNRKMEFLQLAEQEVHRLSAFVAVFPESEVSPGNYIRQPEFYITGVSSEYRQLDKLELAMNQVRSVRDQLKTFL